MIREQGHAIANHSYHHLHAYEVSAKDYLEDVDQANVVLKTHLFRPPKGDLTLRTFLGLHKKYKIVYWALNSEDSDRDRFNYEHAYKNLTVNTKPGDVVLFHFCHRHEKETRQILPAYLLWLHEQGFVGKAIE